MAFFNNSAAYDSYLRRKRSSSTTRERPSRSSTSTSSDGHIKKHSPSPSISIPSTESAESIPPLPSGPLSYSTSITVPAAPASSDPFSTTLHTPRNYKRESPPPFSNLMVNPRRNDSPMNHTPSPSPVNASSPIVPSKELPTRSSSLRRGVPLEIKPPRLQVSPTQIEQCPIPILPSSGKSVSPAAKTSSTRKSHSHTGSLNNSSSSSSPVTPMLFAPSHPSSPGHSPTSHSFSSGPNSSHSSLKRALLSAYNSVEHLTLPGLPSPVSPHMTGKTTPLSETASPIQAGQSSQKRHRNVLRKPSVHSHREPLPQETDKVGMSTKLQDRNHRPRAKSVTISPTRSGAIFDISQPMPTKALNLTPAGEVQAAYRESQRRVRDIDSNSGKLVAVGVPDCSDILRKKSPSSIRATDNFIPDTQPNKGIASVKNGLTKKLSAKWGKTTDKREERFHATSASVTGLPGDLIYGSYTEARPRGRTSKPIDALISPRQRELKLPAEQTRKSHEEGRVWEDTVDDWVINQQHSLPKRDQEMEKSKSVDTEVSNPRRLWKLVKRLSSGNLRGERKQSPMDEPPPVPPLPKDLIARPADHLEDVDILMSQSPILETPKGIMRYISSIPSLTIPQAHIVSPVTKLSSPQEVAPVSSSPRSPTGAGPSRRLRSETTRSSSPSSGTTGFFSRSRSSSTSSYGETLPPMPDMPLTQTILKHGFQGVISPAPAPDVPERNERRNVRSHSKSPPPPHLSPAPRRRSHDTSPSGSATIPWFDVQNPINKFLISKGKRTQYPPLVAFQSAKADNQAQAQNARRPSTANASSIPPPVPSRSPKRPATSSSMSGTVNSRKFSVPSTIHSQGVSSSEDDQNQSSKPRPRSVSDGVMDSPASMTFREMTSVKQPLTEEEKKAKWEDLLNRSAKAGGTLHVVSRTDNSKLWSEKPTAD